MATSWEDLFKFNTELLTDDYNKGQALVVKTKAKSDDNVTVSIMKILLFFKESKAESDSWHLIYYYDIGS
jgi:hypothetical protein